MWWWGRWGEGGSQVVSEWGGDRWSKSCTTVECCTKTRAAVNRWVGSETTTSWKTRQGILRWHWEFRISETAKIRQAHFFLFYDFFFFYLCSPSLSLVSLPLFFQRSPFPHSVWSSSFFSSLFLLSIVLSNSWNQKRMIVHSILWNRNFLVKPVCRDVTKTVIVS